MTTCIGLDVGTHGVRAVQVGRGRKGLVLERVGQVDVPHGVIKEGEIVAPDVVAQCVKELWRRGKFSGKKVSLALANSQVSVRQVDLPSLPPEELRTSLPFLVQEYLPIPVDQALLDCHVIETVTPPEGPELARVLLVAAHRTAVDALVEVASKAGLRPVGLDLEAFAALRALVAAAPARDQEDGAQLVVHLGAAFTSVVAHVAGNPRFVRILSTGGDALVDLLVDQYGCDRDEAAQRVAGLEVPGLDDERSAQLIARGTRRLLDEIAGTAEYYTAQPDAVPVGSVVISGGPSLLPDLDTSLGDHLGLPVLHGRPLDGLAVGAAGPGPEELERAQPFLPVAVGLAMSAP